MKPYRDEHGVLRGDLHYGVGFPATVIPNITPVVFPCTNCNALTLHVAIEQPTGLGFKLPFARKPLATTGRDYGLACNVCSCTSGISGKSIIEKLEQRIVPHEVCDAVDKFLELIPDAPKAYSEGFAKFYADAFLDDPAGYFWTCLSVYRREA